MDLLEKLAFTGTWVSDDAYVYVPTEVHPFLGLFMDSAHQLQEQPFFDDFMTVYCRCHRLYEATVDIIRADHSFKFVEFLLSKRSCECRGWIFSFVLVIVSSNVS